ncbi:hypothetical protein BMS3Bbin09_00082 [bacterium BMS3Bbin09]|nr:hypothetical protein BMS3Bbin09_00082 [bacterium BMS3Bbin09]
MFDKDRNDYLRVIFRGKGHEPGMVPEFLRDVILFLIIRHPPDDLGRAGLAANSHNIRTSHMSRASISLNNIHKGLLNHFNVPGVYLHYTLRLYFAARVLKQKRLVQLAPIDQSRS